MHCVNFDVCDRKVSLLASYEVRVLVDDRVIEFAVYDEIHLPGIPGFRIVFKQEIKRRMGTVAILGIVGRGFLS